MFKTMNMQDILVYIKSLVGTPYVWWQDGESTLDKPCPFYCRSAPPVNTIRKLGTNCAGFINLLCHYTNSPIAGVDTQNYYAGGTAVWYETLKTQNKLEPIQPQKIYPIGTMLLAPFIDVEDQGHVVIVTTAGTIDTVKISHCFPTNGLVMDEDLHITHNLSPTGYYTHSAKPKDWLTNF